MDLKNDIQQQFLFQEAASRILEELTSRGFTVDDPDKIDGLVNKITNIILETVRGNTNYCVTTASEEDDFPPWHPLEY